mgnify:CR=1 FL=1
MEPNEYGHYPWRTEVVVTDASGGEILKITTRGKRPDLERDHRLDHVRRSGRPSE